MRFLISLFLLFYTVFIFAQDDEPIIHESQGPGLNLLLNKHSGDAFDYNSYMTSVERPYIEFSTNIIFAEGHGLLNRGDYVLIDFRTKRGSYDHGVDLGPKGFMLYEYDVTQEVLYDLEKLRIIKLDDQFGDTYNIANVSRKVIPLIGQAEFDRRIFEKIDKYNKENPLDKKSGYYLTGLSSDGKYRIELNHISNPDGILDGRHYDLRVYLTTDEFNPIDRGSIRFYHGNNLKAKKRIIEQLRPYDSSWTEWGGEKLTEDSLLKLKSQKKPDSLIKLHFDNTN